MTSRRILWIALLVGAALSLVPSLLRQPMVLAAQTAMIQVLDGQTVVPNSGGVPGLPVTLPPASVGTPTVKDFTVNNLGSADLFLANLSAPPGFTAEFVGTGQSAVVAPTGSQTLRVTCTAAAGGSFDGLISVNTSDPDDALFTFTVSCVVAGSSAPALAVSVGGSPIANGQAAPVSFPGTVVNTPATLTVTLTNTGTQPLTVDTLGFTGGVFSGNFQSGTPSMTIQPAASAQLNLTCLSSAAGTFDGTVSFASNDPNQTAFVFPVRCIITGTGSTITTTATATSTTSPQPIISVLANGSPVVSGQTTPVQFAPTFINTPVNQTFTIANTGGQPLVVGGLVITGGAFTGAFGSGMASMTVQPSSSAALIVTCSAPTPGTYTGDVSFTTNDPAVPTFTVPVRCVVSDPTSSPDIELLFGADFIDNNQPTAVNLGTTAAGTQLSAAITIRNVGSGDLFLTGLIIAPGPGLATPPPTTIQGNFSQTTIAPNGTATLNLVCFSQVFGTYTATVTFQSNDPDESPFQFSVSCTVAFQTATNTPTPSRTNTPNVTNTRTPIATVIIPTSFLTLVSPTPSLVPTFTPFPTFVFTPFQRTPLPAPACARQAPGTLPRTGFVVVANRDGVNVRTLPAIGAPVIGFVNAGYTAEAEARSGDGEWVRVQIGPGQEGWIGLAVLSVLSGDLDALPVADPRSIPYGGFEAPRAGLTAVTGTVTGRLALSGLRVRSGPSTNYAILANAPRFAVMPVVGRTDDNRWVQVNFEGTLGWAAAEYFEFSSPEVFALPIDGICADAVPLSETGDADFFATLRLLRDRLDLAQPSLDAIRAIWTSVALGGAAQCGGYPIRPTDFNIPQALLAAYVDRLLPLETDFNAAMAALRLSIEILIESCSFGQPPVGSVGQAAVQQALDAVNTADALFAQLRRRIAELLPPDSIADDECLFVFRGSAAVVKRLEVGQPRNAQLTTRPAQYVIGFCFDAPAGQTFRVELLRLSGNAAPRITVSSFDNPTNFIAQADASATQEYVSLQPILIPEDGRYLVLVSDLELASAIGQGDFVILLTNTTGVSFAAPSLSIDPETGQILVDPVPQQSFPGQTLVPPGQQQSGGSAGNCPNITFTCQQLLDCNQALACYLAGNTSLDGNADGVPCENLCTGGARPTAEGS